MYQLTNKDFNCGRFSEIIRSSRVALAPTKDKATFKMLQQDEGNVVVLAVDATSKPPAETGKDQLNEISKPMFLRKNFQKHGPLMKKDVSFSKSKSRISKKKPPKDKFKLFKLDKRLTMQMPQLGKSAKCLKRNDNLGATTQMSGSQVLGKEKTSCDGRTNQIWSFRPPKPMEYTFDLFCSTDNISLSPLVKEPKHTGKPLFTELLTTSSLSEKIMLASRAGTNIVLEGDLIDLGTPKTFKSKADHPGSRLSVFPMDKSGEVDEVLQLNLNPLLINSAEPCTSGALAPLGTPFFNDVENVSGLLENQSARDTALIKDAHNNPSSRNSGFGLDDQPQSGYSELALILNNEREQDEGVTSPLVFYGFPGLKSPNVGKEHILTAPSRQTLVGYLIKNPFPKVVREKGKVRVRRRAFSMDDTLIAFLPSGPREEVVDPESVDKVDKIVNEEALCPQNSELISSSQKSSEPIENLKHSSLMEEVSDSDRETICSNSNEMISSDLSHDSKDTTLESSTDSAIDKHKSFLCSSYMSAAADNQSIPEKESNPTLPFEPPNVHISKEDSIGNTLESFIESSSIDKECRCVPDCIEDSSVASDCPQTGNLLSSLASDSTHVERAGEDLEEAQPEDSVEESADGGVSFGQQQVSLDFVNPRSRSLELEMSNFTTSEKGLLVNRNVDECSYREIPSQNFLEHTPSPSDEKELSECLAPGPKVSLQMDPSKLVMGNNVDDMSGQLTSNLVSALITSPAVNQETAITLGSLPRVDPNTENKEEFEDEASTKPPEEIVSPTTVAFDDSDNDSIFCDESCITPLEHWVLPPGKKYRRSLSIIRNLDEHPPANARRGRHYEKSVEEIIRLQGNNAEAWTPVQSLRQRLSIRRSSWMRQITPPPVRRSTFIWSPTIPSRRTLFESPLPRKSVYSTPMQHNLVHRVSVRASPMHGPRRPITRSSINQDGAPASPVQYTIKDLILTICKQTEPCSFSDILSQESYSGGCKLGEGVFGEVFSISRVGQSTVLKIIPIEGQQLVNGEKQKTYQEVLSELVIAKVLDELRYEGSDESNQTSGYAQLIATSLVQGSYPEPLLRFWEEFDQTKGSDNENPKIFDEEQLFIVMEQGNGGKDVESYTFSSAKQSLSVLKQIAFSLAVAEISVEFEHRDLHWGNVLVSKTSQKQISYTLNGTQYAIPSNGVKCTIIDYTLSRIKYINQVPIFNDVGKDPEMFIATGDYQFDIYRLMKKDVEDDWCRFAPKTNARWLHYLLDKMLTKVKYQRKTAKAHKDSFKALEEIGTWIEDCGSALSIAMRLAESKH